jgi:hypothetical protein
VHWGAGCADFATAARDGGKVRSHSKIVVSEAEAGSLDPAPPLLVGDLPDLVIRAADDPTAAQRLLAS